MTTMNTNTMSTAFTFRSKFEKLLNDENRQVIEAAFEKFCSLNPRTTIARDFLWELTYNPEVSFETLQDLGLNYEIISPENVSKLRDELRHQYEKLHKGYLTVDVSEECIPAFEALIKQADPIVASVVNERCRDRMYGYDVPRTLFLLSSDKENFFFGGICDVGFMSKEAEYLKPLHMQIHDLLKAMYDLQQEVSRNTPLSRLDSILKDGGMELPFTFGENSQEEIKPLVEETQDAVELLEKAQVETPTEAPNEAQVSHPAETNSGFKELTPETIVEHKDVFTSFTEDGDMNILLKIRNLGFDLNKIISKKDAICKVLEANAKKDSINELLHQVTALKEIADSLILEATISLNN